MKTIFQEILNDMDEFFAEIDAIIGREPEMTDEEAEYWEMKAEIHNEI